MPAGRPIEYNEEIILKAKEYLDLSTDQEVIKTNGEKMVVGLKVKLPSIGGLARHLGIARSTIYEWRDKYQEFSDIIEQLLAEQEDRLINSGLSGDYNATISKVILSKHGYREGQELTGLEGKNLIPETITKEQQDALVNLLK